MDLLQQLKKSSKLQTLEDENLFIDTLKQMAESRNKEYLPAMLSYLDDDSEFSDILKIIIGMAESFPKGEYVESVINSIDVLRLKAEDWLEYIHYRITNSEEYTLAYREALRKTKEKDIVIDYLKDFSQKNPEKINQIELILEPESGK